MLHNEFNIETIDSMYNYFDKMVEQVVPFCDRLAQDG